MRICAYCCDGRSEEFDTSTLTSSSLFSRSNVMTDIELTLEESGLWADISYYDSASTTTQKGHAGRVSGTKIHLLTADELARVVLITEQDKERFLRVGPAFVDMIRFQCAMQIFFEPDLEPRVSLASKAELLLSTIMHKLPGRERAFYLQMMGIPEASFEFMSGLGVSVDGGQVFIKED